MGLRGCYRFSSVCNTGEPSYKIILPEPVGSLTKLSEKLLLVQHRQLVCSQCLLPRDCLLVSDMA